MRQKRSAILIFTENLVQCVNLTFYTMPNVYLIKRPCALTDPFLRRCAYIRWTCWNSVSFLIWLGTCFLATCETFLAQADGYCTMTADQLSSAIQMCGFVSAAVIVKVVCFTPAVLVRITTFITDAVFNKVTCSRSVLTMTCSSLHPTVSLLI